ncbi:MAG: DUF6130 family protein [Pyrinomonadaceae bacterium]
MADVWGMGLTKRSIRVVAILTLCTAAAVAQTTNTKCRPEVIPVETEPPPKLFVDAPLAAPLARGVAVIQYCSENLHIVPVFGAKALAVTPRVGHLHVRVDDASWVWAEASGNPIILMGLAPGPHKVTIELVNANHQPLDKAEVTFNIPKAVSGEGRPEKRPASDKRAKNTARGDDLDAVHHPQ